VDEPIGEKSSSIHRGDDEDEMEPGVLQKERRKEKPSAFHPIP
jgi:hypothetical protein